MRKWKGRVSYQGNWWGSQPSSQGFLGGQKPWERGWWESVTQGFVVKRVDEDQIIAVKRFKS